MGLFGSSVSCDLYDPDSCSDCHNSGSDDSNDLDLVLFDLFLHLILLSVYHILHIVHYKTCNFCKTKKKIACKMQTTFSDFLSMIYNNLIILLELICRLLVAYSPPFNIGLVILVPMVL